MRARFAERDYNLKTFSRQVDGLISVVSLLVVTDDDVAEFNRWGAADPVRRNVSARGNRPRLSIHGPSWLSRRLRLPSIPVLPPASQESRHGGLEFPPEGVDVLRVHLASPLEVLLGVVSGTASVAASWRLLLIMIEQFAETRVHWAERRADEQQARLRGEVTEHLRLQLQARGVSEAGFEDRILTQILSRAAATLADLDELEILPGSS